jgi:hypothetical protein
MPSLVEVKFPDIIALTKVTCNYIGYALEVIFLLPSYICTIMNTQKIYLLINLPRSMS